jgi:hypothetical protein
VRPRRSRLREDKGGLGGRVAGDELRLDSPIGQCFDVFGRRSHRSGAIFKIVGDRDAQKLPDELGWAVRISWPDERSETVVAFVSEDDANVWIRDSSAAWILRTEALRKLISAATLESRR